MYTCVSVQHAYCCTAELGLQVVQVVSTASFTLELSIFKMLLGV